MDGTTLDSPNGDRRPSRPTKRQASLRRLRASSTMRATFVKPVRPVAKSIARYRWFAAMSLRRFSIATVALALVALGLNVPAVMAAGPANAPPNLHHLGDG